MALTPAAIDAVRSAEHARPVRCGFAVRLEVEMPAPVPVQRIARLGLRVAAALSFLAPLLTRLVVGQAFFLTGRGKLLNFENTVTFFTELGIPYPQANAALVGSLELVGGVCLILGLLTRIMSAGLAATMVVALMTADKGQFLKSLDPSSDVSPMDVSSFVFLMLFLWLVLYGPGIVSLDTFLARWLGIGNGPYSSRATG
jgi:putative oxidoreductase